VNPGNHPGGLAKLLGSFIMHKNGGHAIVMGPSKHQQKPFYGLTECLYMYGCISSNGSCASLTLCFAAPVFFFSIDLSCPLWQDTKINVCTGEYLMMRLTLETASEMGEALLDAVELAKNINEEVGLTTTRSGKWLAISGDHDCGTRFVVDPPIKMPDAPTLTVVS